MNSLSALINLPRLPETSWKVGSFYNVQVLKVLPDQKVQILLDAHVYTVKTELTLQDGQSLRLQLLKSSKDSWILRVLQPLDKALKPTESLPVSWLAAFVRQGLSLDEERIKVRMKLFSPQQLQAHSDSASLAGDWAAQAEARSWPEGYNSLTDLMRWDVSRGQKEAIWDSELKDALQDWNKRAARGNLSLYLSCWDWGKGRGLIKAWVNNPNRKLISWNLATQAFGPYFTLKLIPDQQNQLKGKIDLDGAFLKQVKIKEFYNTIKQDLLPSWELNQVGTFFSDKLTLPRGFNETL